MYPNCLTILCTVFRSGETRGYGFVFNVIRSYVVPNRQLPKFLVDVSSSHHYLACGKALYSSCLRVLMDLKSTCLSFLYVALLNAFNFVVINLEFAELLSLVLTFDRLNEIKYLHKFFFNNSLKVTKLKSFFLFKQLKLGFSITYDKQSMCLNNNHIFFNNLITLSVFVIYFGNTLGRNLSSKNIIFFYLNLNALVF